ncbi:MAG: hypothetical protein NTZ84_02125 [Candidatus Nealsonbacteria bacterium]|nr:hypothetical protein [Candidatus Nealsonbacteria bacterium]
MPPDDYYFFKEAKYYPEEKTFVVRVNIIKSVAEGISPGKGYEKEMLVEEIRSSIADLSGGVFERLYREIDSAVSEAYTICK